MILIIAILISIVLFPIGFVFAVFYSGRRKYFYNVSRAIDQLGNVICARLFNLTLIKHYSIYKFGNEDETISSVIGKNKLVNTLTLLGKTLDFILNFLDRNHSIKAIENDE
jgi:hypothetical protein